MATSDSIAPFPADIDRAYFGAWLSGFTDGEGCFRLDTVNISKGHATPIAVFSIALRRDDEPILRLIQSYLACGKLYTRERTRSRPQSELFVRKIEDVIGIIIPHFERFPLMAKKAADFHHFKLGAELAYSVASRPIQHRGKGGGKGSLPKWTEAERDQFYDIQAALTEQREYREPS